MFHGYTSCLINRRRRFGALGIVLTDENARIREVIADQEGRSDAVMAGMVMALSEQDMLELGSYFAAQKVSAGNGSDNELGRKLYFGGDAARGITACVSCHGVKGNGMPKAGFPAVAGQHVEYLAAQLNQFSKKTRANDKNGMMRSIAKRLKKDDVAALSQFMSSLK